MAARPVARLLVLALVSALACGLCVLAARWQWQRYEENAARTAAVEASLTGPATPVRDLLAPGEPASPADEYRLVEATGRYDADELLVVRLRPRDGATGAEELVPLRTADGTALLVNRGWYQAASDGSSTPPPPPSGEVTVQARVMPPETGRGTGGDPATGAVRFYDVEGLRAAYPYPVYGAYADLVREEPHPAGSPALPPAPTFTLWLHSAYTVQWYVFAVGAVVGGVVLARSERLRPGERAAGGATARRRARTPSP